MCQSLRLHLASYLIELRLRTIIVDNLHSTFGEFALSQRLLCFVVNFKRMYLNSSVLYKLGGCLTLL